MRNNIAAMSVVGESPSSSGCGGAGGGGGTSWSKLLECGTDLVENAVSVFNNQALWDHIRASSGMPMYNMQGGTSAGEMKDGWMNSAVSNDIVWTTENSNNVLKKFESGSAHDAGVKIPQTPNSFGSLSNYSGSNNPGHDDGKLIFQAGLDAETFPCGPFTRLLDPSTTLECADSLELGLEDFSASKNNPPLQPHQLSSHNAAAPLKALPTFQSSNILTFHSNMSKLDMAAFSASKPATNIAQNLKAGGSPSDSSPSTSSSNNTLQKSAVDESGECTTEQKRSSDQVGLSNTAFKKPRTEASNSGPMKVRKEKLGERITALQQLVSPFGKTDTASVLLEAMGYIKFLQEQVQVLSTPYLKGIPSAQNDQAKYDLRSRGLCLVPVACTLNVANNNGADFWTSGLGSSSKF